MLITQSLVKSLEENCPRKTYNEFVGGYNRTSIDMERGSYFETLCLGAGAHGVVTTSLPLLKSGEKSIDQKRIEQQSERFKNMFDPTHSDFTGKTIAEKQVTMTFGDRSGTLDFTTNPLILYDLKLTENLDGWWGDTAGIDFIQQIHYRWLYQMTHNVTPEIRLLIFEYSNRMRIKEIKINISEEATQSALDRFSRIEDTVAEYAELEEWPRIPSLNSCSKCPLQCGRRVIKDSIIFEEINL